MPNNIARQVALTISLLENLYEKIIRNKRNIPHPIIEYNKSVSPFPEILFFKIAINELT